MYIAFSISVDLYVLNKNVLYCVAQSDCFTWKYIISSLPRESNVIRIHI